MRRLSSLSLALAALLLATLPLALAQGTYTQIDEPNAVGQTYCYGVDTAGDIVGYYVDASSIGHGFLLSGGIYTTIDYPGANGTIVTGINDNGQIVGSTTSTPTVGFLYDLATQTFTTIAHPHAYQTFPWTISNNGTIVGGFEARQNTGNFTGFALSKSNYMTINPPGIQYSFATGIADTAEIAGYIAVSAKGEGGFLFKAGKYHVVDISGSANTVVYGINPSGSALAGYYQPTLGTSVGFLYQRGTTQTLEFPGAMDTGASGVNNAGEVVGFFYDPDGTAHGFTWTPPAPAEKK